MMYLKTRFLTALFIFNLFLIQGQITNFIEKFELPIEVKETSGLLLIEGKIVTHNDSGDASNLYELDSLSGNLTRTISISNATNVDWEDLAEDEDFIYIGDIGNNNGNRDDLKIYKILKSDFRDNSNVTAEVISFSYEDQTNFTSLPNNNNFDAESIVIFDNSILIFTKNWSDLKTNVYKLPLSTGNHIAAKVSTANIEGLITGGSLENDNFLLTGYSTNLVPFLIHISSDRMPGDDIFASGFEKRSLSSHLPQGSQVEGITSLGSNLGKYYISRESLSTTIFGVPVVISQKIYAFSYDTNQSLSVEENGFKHLTLHPNPVLDKISIITRFPIARVEIYDSKGKIILTKTNLGSEIDISSFSNGVYYLKIQSENKDTVFKKIIKL